MRSFISNVFAVSQVIGVVLMVAITVIVAAVVAIFVFGTSGEQQKPPTTSIVAINDPDTQEADIKIQHKGGDVLVGGGWKLSVVPVGSPVTFISANSTTEFRVGNQIRVTNTTIGANWLNETELNGGGPLLAGTEYDVKLIQYPSEALLVDMVVDVR